MTSTQEDTIFDFDLNYLLQTTNNTSNVNISEKQKRSVAILKKKTIATNSLIGKYYAKNQELEETQKNLLSAKEDCKQICIDYTKALETCAKLETEINIIQSSKKQLEEKCFNADNQYEAIKSHTNQLQALVNENTTTIKTLEDERKSQNAIIRNNKKRISSLQNENQTLLKHVLLFKDIILGRRKLCLKYKAVLQGYDKHKSLKNTDDELSECDNSDIGDDIFEDVMSPYNECNNISETKKAISSTLETPMELDNDCSNEIVSVDTGRGSSLAFSDTEKCFHSPDYYSDDSPLSREIIENKARVKLVNTATSPLPVRTKEVATSPVTVLEEDTVVCQIIVQDEDFRNSLEHKIQNSLEHQDERSVSPVQLNLDQSDMTSLVSNFRNSLEHKNQNSLEHQDDRSVTPLQLNLDQSGMISPVRNLRNSLEHTTKNSLEHQDDRSVSPVQLNMNQSGMTSPVRNIDKPVPSPIEVSNILTHKDVQHARQTIQEQECLQVNSSYKYSDDNSNDFEIETILNTMRFNHDIITPIPPTPAKTRLDSDDVLKRPASNECRAAVLAREENKEMRATIANLGKEMVNMKSLLENQLLFFKDYFAQKGIHSVSPNKLSNVDNNKENHDGNNSEDVGHCIDNNESNICSPLPEDPITIPSPESLIQLADLSLPDTASILDPLDENTCDTIIVENTFDDNRSPKRILDRLELQEPDILAPVKTNSIDQADASNLDRSGKEAMHGHDNREVEYAKDNHVKQIKHKKVTKLEKLKRKLAPKYKIKSDKTQVSKNLRLRPKRPLVSKPNVNATRSDNSVSLNDKDVYEKAVKIMAELKAKQPNVSRCPGNSDINSKDEVTNSLEDVTISQKQDNSVSDVNDPISSVTTRSRKKCIEQSEEGCNKITTVAELNPSHNNSEILAPKTKEYIDSTLRTSPRITRKRIREPSLEKSEILSKRILRSSVNRNSVSDDKAPSNSMAATIDENDVKTARTCTEIIEPTRKNQNTTIPIADVTKKQSTKQVDNHTNVITYGDLDIFTDENSNKTETSVLPKESVLGLMIQKYGVKSVKTSAKKVSDATIKTVCEIIERQITDIIEIPAIETKNAMNKLVADLQKFNHKQFITGLMKYLKDPERKTELFAKIITPPAPAMTKSEQVLLYIISQLRSFWPNVDTVDSVLCNIEFALFQLNRTPDFNTIESMSHFYAVLCRYCHAKSRLRIFILDAMYCLQFKSVPLIKQCLEVWMHIIPLAHMGLAKSPLVTCLVFLLHFYKCEDKFNRVQEIRNILHRKYFYEITEWNEPKILEMFKNAIKDVKDIPLEKKMLRLALIILAKRHGPRWCQNNIIKNLLQPMIEKKDVPDRVKEFCVTMIGPLMKPYSVDMKVHCEIAVNQLVDIWNESPSDRMAEAVIASLVCMNKHSQHRVNKILLSRKLHDVSPELEVILRDFVREKPLKIWKTIFSKTQLR